MKKIKSTKAFKDAVDVAFDTQTKRDRKKREYDEQRKAFDERHDALCEYALGHPEVLLTGTMAASSVLNGSISTGWTAR